MGKTVEIREATNRLITSVRRAGPGLDCCEPLAFAADGKVIADIALAAPVGNQHCCGASGAWRSGIARGALVFEQMKGVPYFERNSQPVKTFA